MRCVLPDAFWNGVFALLVAIVVGYFQYKTKEAVEKASSKADNGVQNAVTEVQKVKEALKVSDSVTIKKLDAVATELKVNTDVTEKIHTLSNSSRGILLNALADLAERMAVMTGKDLDVKAAKEARKQADEHDDLQGKIIT